MGCEIRSMPKKSSFKVRIHDFDHPPPHCHVYCSDGAMLRVTIPFLAEIDGKRIRKEIREFLEANLDELAEEWDEKNPKLH